MEITQTPIAVTAPDVEALEALVGQYVVVSFATGSVIGASGYTVLESVHGSLVTLATKGIRRDASISLIDSIASLAIVPRQGRRF